MILQFIAVLGKTLSYIASCMVALFILHRDEQKKIDPAITEQAIALAIVLNHVE